PNLHLWMIPLLPLIGAFINGFFGRRFNKQAITVVAWAFPGAAFALAINAAARFSSLHLPYSEQHGEWIHTAVRVVGNLADTDFVVNFGFYLDQLSLVMLLVVTGVGLLIHIYSAGYMWEEDSYYRFFAYLNLFMFFMLMLVLADNYLLMFVGWE